MDNGGELRVTARNGSQEGSTEITVQDTGCGMAPEVLERAFDPYFTSKPRGTGLGLAIVYRIIDEHGGNVWISSKENQGTTVTMTLPSGPATKDGQG
jgi:two-component system sensor histidine kinase HydH